MNGRLPRIPQTGQFSWKQLVKVCLGLLLGFLALRTGLGAYLSDAIALVLALVSTSMLDIVHGDVLRAGTELRSQSTGYALSVTSACDGLGLSVTFIAILFALARVPINWLHLMQWTAIGIAVIQAFNLLRIIVLFELLPATSIGFGLVHFQAFPLASAVLVGGLIAVAMRTLPVGSLGKAGSWLGFVAASAVIWYFVSDAVTFAVAVPIANALIAMVPGILIDGIGSQNGGVFVNTNLVSSNAPLSLASLPISPSDFTLGVPLLASSLLLAAAPPRKIALLVLAALLMMPLAMAIATFALAQGEAIAGNLTELQAASRRAAYEPPDDLGRGIVAAVQNSVVHFNLFILPFVVFFISRRTRPEPPPRKGRRRG